MGTILFIRIFLVSDGSDTSGVPFAIPMQEDSRNVKTLPPTLLHEPGAFVSSQSDSGLSFSGAEHRLGLGGEAQSHINQGMLKHLV